MNMNKKNTLSRRTFLHLTGLAVAGTALQACGSGSPQATPKQDEVINLVYQDWRTEWFPPLVQETMVKFQATHPNIRVFYTPDPEDLESSMPADLAAGTAPDVFQGCCSLLPVWAQNGHLLDLRPYIDRDLDQDTIKDWNQAQYQAFQTEDGKQFGLPKYHGALALYYNKDLFDQYGVAYPNETWTHEEYLTAMKALTHDRDKDGRTDLWGSMLDPAWERIQIHINGFGGHIVDPTNPSRCLLTAPEAMEAMEWLRARMLDDKVMATFVDVQNLGTREAFITQRVAMVEDGSWALRDILEKATFRVGVAIFPAGPVKRVTLATTDSFAIYAKTHHPDEAWELLKFLISKEYGLAMAKASFLQPSRASLVQDWVEAIRQAYPEKTEGLDIAAFADGHIKGYSVTAETFANMTQAASLIKESWRAIFTLGQQPLSIMKDVCQKIETTQP
jgi:multiple sugar transport system substrate-binding protein